MDRSATPDGPFLKWQSWRYWLFAALAGALAITAEQGIEHFEKRSQLQHEKSHVLNGLSQLRARLEGAINGNLLLTQALSAVIAAQPDIDQDGFARIARNLVDPRHALRNIAGAPDLVVSLIYPIEGNEAAIGLDYRTHPTQRDAAMRAVESADTVIAGPLSLVQGGNALIAREPVFLPSITEGGEPRLWGLVSAVINVDKLYPIAGLSSPGRYADLAVAIRGKDGTGARGETFFGDPGLFARDPVTIMVTLPGGEWQIAAIPAEGWGQHQHDLEWIRAAGFTVALILALMTYLLARDIAERRRAERELRASAERLEAAESIAHIGNWEYRVEDGRIRWSDESYRIFGLAPQEKVIDYDWMRSRVHPDDRVGHDAYLQRLLDTRPGDTVPEHRYRIFRTDGEERLLSVWVKPDYDNQQKPSRLFGTIQDVTETYQMQHDLEARLRELTRWQGVMLGREERIQELKREINRLLTDQGRPARYPSQADQA
jgi:PAS domain S-box-containing protein